jgi:lysophospholipase L1-like esterase
VRRFALMALTGLLPTLSTAEEALAAATGPATASALVSNPCPPQLAMPSAMAEGLDHLLTTGAAPVDPQSALTNPDVQAYLQALQERARTDWPNLCRYRTANAGLSQPTRVVFMGDSITEFWARADTQMFSNGVVGRGISGQTSPQMLLRFYQDVIELHPRLVHIMAGTNDLAGNTGPTSAQDFKNNISAMVELANAHKIKVVLASIPPASAFPWRPGLLPAADILALNGWLRGYAKMTGSWYVDYYSALADPYGGFQNTLSNDGVHPNRDGYAKMRSLVMKAIH